MHPIFSFLLRLYRGSRMVPYPKSVQALKVNPYRSISVFLLSLGLLVSPLTVFGLAGSNNTRPEFIAIYVGYILYLLGAALGIWKRKFLLVCVVGVLIFSVGVYLDALFWKSH